MSLFIILLISNHQKNYNMKKLLVGAVVLGFLTSCQNDEISNPSGTGEVSSTESIANKRVCPSEEIREKALLENPDLMKRFKDLETHTSDFEKQTQLGKVLADGTVEIPVIVNVLYSTTAQNVTDARIAEQIAVLNADFGGTNSDITKVPSEFNSVKAGNTKIKFRLSKVNRKSTTKSNWSTDNSMKRASTGGIDATSPANYLNIWVVGRMPTTNGDVLGYATFPESAGLWNDGVVIAAPYFGKTGASAPFNLGRTATHEVGHYLNLRHIWGDANCGNDLVADTPQQQTSTVGAPTYPRYQTCGGVSRSIMFMNYMDYVNDGAMYMFSAGQRTRAQAVVASSGPRSGLRLY